MRVALPGTESDQRRIVDRQEQNGGKHMSGVRCVAMHQIHRLAGTVNVEGCLYDWEVRREPQWSEAEGWQGATVALRQQDTQREALIEFPPPKRLLKGLPRGRLQVNDAIVSRGIRAALSAGWEPDTRGKSMWFMVDADGN